MRGARSLEPLSSTYRNGSCMNGMKSASCRIAALAICALVAGCQSEDTAPRPSFVSNRAGMAVPSQANRYFIEFRSRYALSYGHAYVVFGRTNQAGKMINLEVAGLAPASSSATPYVLGHVIPVRSETGWSDGDLEEAYRSASWRVTLTEPEYREVVAYIRRLQASSPVRNATFYNCNAFVGKIAQSMGYKAPSHWLRPRQYITRLREMNTGSNAG